MTARGVPPRPARRSRRGASVAALALGGALQLSPAAVGAQPAAEGPASHVVAGDTVERLVLGRAEVAVATRQGLGIVVMVRGRFAPTVVTLPPDDVAAWSARVAQWLDATRRAVVEEAHPLRSPPTLTPGPRLFIERGVVDGRSTVALAAVDSAGQHGTVLEMTESELRDVLTMIWAVSSERDSSLLAHETLGGDSVFTERGVTKWAHPRHPRRTARYPELLREAGIEGGVVLSFVIDSTGAPLPSTIEVLDATHEAFTEAVMEFVRHLTFEPAEVRGHKVKARCILPFSFGLLSGSALPRRPRSDFDVLRIVDRDPHRRPAP